MSHATTLTSSTEPNPIDTTGLCLLSLDGGGVRGLSTLYILKSIMDRLNHARAKAQLPSVKPCEIFDLIGGTSTGGLIAIMLGRLEMDVDACIEAYSDLAAAVFGEKLSSSPFNWKGQVKSRFDSTKLKAAIRKVVEASGRSSQDLINDGIERGCRTFVCTADRDTKNIVRLRSYSLPHEPDIRATICQAGLATSAATTFFEPVSIGNRSFADGGLGANNPVDEVEGEAANIWCYKTGEVKPLVKCFISIGTGNPGTKPFESSIVKFLGRTVVQIATETDNTERRFIARWARHFVDKRYFRFNVEDGLQDVGLEEYEKKGVVEAATESYLTHFTRKFRVGECIDNLRLKQNRAETSLATVVNEYAIRISQQQPTHRTSWIVPYEKNDRFTGRDAELKQLEQLLSVSDHTAKIAVIGLGGVGKTQLVLELLIQTKEKHRDWTIIWISATSNESLHQGYLDAAQQLGLSGWDDEKNDVKRLVQRHLSNEETDPWILVFDNADDIDMWVGKAARGSPTLINCLPKSKQGAILFTTRDKKLAVKLVQQNVVTVPAMDENEATQLLEKCLIDPVIDRQQDISALLSQLTYLPLAIVQAAAYLNENDASISDYLLLLAQQEEELVEILSQDFDYDGRHGDLKDPVATTWLISFERIRERDSLAANYLSFMACIEAKDIPQSLLPSGSTRKEEIDALGTLVAYSFVTRRPGGLALDLHRLVHLATRNWLRKKEELGQWTENTITRLEKVFPSRHHAYRRLWRVYLSHVRYVIGSDLVSKDWDTRLALMWRYAMCLCEDGRWDQAVVCFEEHVEATKGALGAEHPNTLASMNNLALTYFEQSRWTEAEKLEMQVIETRKRVLGAEHVDTLISMNNIASMYTDQGRWTEAENLNVQVTETFKRVLGAEHPNTLTSMNNLASTYRKQGRWTEAEKLNIQVIEMSKRVLGAEHPHTLASMNNLASTYWKQSRWTKAEKLNIQVIEMCKRVLGAEHPDTLASMNNLALAYFEQSRWTEAEKLNIQVIEMCKRVLGAEHPDTLASMSNLASTYWKQSRWTKAEKLNIQVIEMSKRVLGAEHPDTLASMNNLALTYFEQSRWTEAEKLEVQAMETRERVLGAEHPDTLASMNNLASTYRKQGRWTEAENLVVRVTETRKRVLGAEHVDTLTSMNNLACIFQAQGKIIEATELMARCVQAQTRVLGAGHPRTIFSSKALLKWCTSRNE